MATHGNCAISILAHLSKQAYWIFSHYHYNCCALHSSYKLIRSSHYKSQSDIRKLQYSIRECICCILNFKICLNKKRSRVVRERESKRVLNYFLRLLNLIKTKVNIKVTAQNRSKTYFNLLIPKPSTAKKINSNAARQLIASTPFLRFENPRE